MEKKKRKWPQIVGIVVLVILVLLVLHTGRNFVILSALQVEAADYCSKENYYVKSVTTMNEYDLVIDSYKKGNKKVTLLEKTDKDGKKVKLSWYSESKRMYVNTETEKSVKINTENVILAPSVENQFAFSNNLQAIITGMTSTIWKTIYNNEECYAVNYGSIFDILFNNGKNTMYINKDTGLLIGQKWEDSVTVKEYDFENIDESVFSEPDINDYVVKD